jgi:hypothetical protein
MANVTSNNERIILLNANIVSGATSDAVSSREWRYNAIQGILAGSATLDVEISLDGTNFVKLGSTLSTSGIVQIPVGVYSHIRVKKSASTDAVTAVLLRVRQ